MGTFKVRTHIKSPSTIKTKQNYEPLLDQVCPRAKENGPPKMGWFRRCDGGAVLLEGAGLAGAREPRKARGGGRVGAGLPGRERGFCAGAGAVEPEHLARCRAMSPAGQTSGTPSQTPWGRGWRWVGGRRTLSAGERPRGQPGCNELAAPGTKAAPPGFADPGTEIRAFRRGLHPPVPGGSRG